MTNIGDKAPEFSLKDQHDDEIKLSEFHGKKVLLAFFPFAFSPVCTDEMTCFTDDLDELKKHGLYVLAISIDSGWSQKAWAEQNGIAHPVLSDFSRTVCKAYGTLREEGFSNRAYFLVDEHGKIAWKHVMANPGTKLDNKDILEALKKV